MNYFVTFKEHKYTVQFFIEYTQSKNCIVISYDDIFLYTYSIEDVVILCDIDRCDDVKLEEIIEYYNKLKSFKCKILNNPKYVLRRFDLLKLLFKNNINQFNLFRISDLNDRINYPVFIRDEYEHSGPETELIYDKELLKKRLIYLENKNRSLIVEFVDTRQEGHTEYTKYGAFYLEGNVIPRHYFESQNWVVKGNSNKPNYQKEESYMTSQNHNKFIKEIFQIANIEYGRIDYCETETGFQVFEINTNPTILDHTDIEVKNPRVKISEMFMVQFNHVLKYLNK